MTAWAVHGGPAAMKTWLGWLFCLLLFGSASGLGSTGSWRPLWNGKSLEGWHAIGKGKWRIQNGVLRALHDKGEMEFGHLVSDQTFDDFIFQLKFKVVKGNSGVYMRAEEKGFGGMTGLQVEIDAAREVGGLYETNGRKWISKPSPDAVKQWFKPGGWNTLTISAHGGRIVVTINGMITAESKNDPGRRAGKIALQLTGGQQTEVWFKDIEIRE